MHYIAREYDEAIQQLQTVITVNPNLFLAHRFLGATYLEKQMYEEAIAELQTAADLAERNSLDLSFLGWAYMAGGQTAQASEIFQELEQLQAEGKPIDLVARFHMHWVLDAKEEAFFWLERAIDDNNGMVRWLKVSPLYDALQSDARFQNLLRRMNFPP